jgi:hypothetical protein
VYNQPYVFPGAAVSGPDNAFVNDNGIGTAIDHFIYGLFHID